MLLSLSHANIETVVHQRYIKSLGSDQESRLHRLLAGLLPPFISKLLLVAQQCFIRTKPRIANS